ncbi:hypothetical protein H0H87_011601 [Tephrocybe sp. NHM501043]|nr:hypothetical protein H0H87_011601 [Tephrocybe sp. NHM501043]
MAAPEARQKHLEIFLLERDLKEEQEKTLTLLKENTRLENEIRDLRRKLALATSVAQAEMHDLREHLSVPLDRASPGVSLSENEPPTNETPSMPAVIDVDALDPYTGPDIEMTSSPPSNSPTAKPKLSSDNDIPMDSSENELSNIKIKKDEALMLSVIRGAGYLEGASALTINPPPSPFIFTRQFLNNIYGGSVQEFLAHSRDKSRLFIFPTSDVNPWMPTAPGSPGLLLTCRKAMLKERCTLVSRVQTEPMAKWMYYGEYHCVVVGKMTKEEFASQRQTVKNKWGEKLLDAQKWPEYVEMRARILSRKQVKNLKNGRHASPSSSAGELTLADAIAALEAGEEDELCVVRPRVPQEPELRVQFTGTQGKGEEDAPKEAS